MNNPYDNDRVNEYGQVVDENGNVVLNEYGQPTYSYSQGQPIFNEDGQYGAYNQGGYSNQGAYGGQGTYGQQGTYSQAYKPGEPFVNPSAYNPPMFMAFGALALGIVSWMSLSMFSMTGPFGSMVGLMLSIVTLTRLKKFSGLKHTKLTIAKVVGIVAAVLCALRWAYNFIVPFSMFSF